MAKVIGWRRHVVVGVTVSEILDPPLLFHKIVKKYASLSIIYRVLVKIPARNGFIIVTSQWRIQRLGRREG